MAIESRGAPGEREAAQEVHVQAACQRRSLGASAHSTLVTVHLGVRGPQAALSAATREEYMQYLYIRRRRDRLRIYCKQISSVK